MSGWQIALLAASGIIVLFVAFIAWLLAVGRHSDARALAGFVPDCAVLFQRLLRDRRVPRASKVLLASLAVYLVIPIDLVPDFIPVAGQLDDAILVAFVLRRLLRTTDEEVIAAHWPGPAASLNLLLRIAGRKNSSAAKQRRVGAPSAEAAAATERKVST
jgi:uncharacterized membrane protein YkvA (DUF1232 family)